MRHFFLFILILILIFLAQPPNLSPGNNGTPGNNGFKNLLCQQIVKSELLSIQPLLAQQPLQAPETIEEAKYFGKAILEAIPNAIRGVWQKEVLPFWQRTWVSWWHFSIQPRLKNIWQKIQSFFAKEIEERKPGIEREFKKEKEEMKEEIPKVGESLWKRFKEIIK